MFKTSLRQRLACSNGYKGRSRKMQAIILAAGQGTRLQPLTNHQPKCLVQVLGKSILQYELESIERAGIRNCTIVVGYRGDQIQSKFGSLFGTVDISYVYNHRFHETNNLYSLWLARQTLDTDTILVEGDLIFEDGLLGDLLENPLPDLAVVDRFQPSMDGTVILADGGFATSMVLKSEQSASFDYRAALKTVNVYRLSQTILQHRFVPILDRYVAEGHTNQFYEAIMAHLIAQGDLRLGVHRTGSRWWAEIDTQEDLHQAERKFRELSEDHDRRSGGDQTTEEFRRASASASRRSQR